MYMSEQTIQEGLYSIPVQLDKYICRSLGATTIKDLVKNFISNFRLSA